MIRILVAEDEHWIARGLEEDFRLEGFEVETVFDGESAVRRARETHFDLMILDVMLPAKDGLQVCRELRRARVRTAIILLTARASEAEKVLGFESGADDYVTKPFSPVELRARVKAVLRRCSGTHGPSYRFGRIEVDTDRFEVRRDGQSIDLTAIEFRLLTLFLRSRGRVLTRDQLIDGVWPEGADCTGRVVDTHVANLRKKIEDEPARPKFLLSVRGVGYRFEV